MNNTNEKVCKICNVEPSKYCCPRCNILYCSLLCYKSEKHAQCSESFYRDFVVQELSSRDDESNLESKKKMQEILTRLNANEGDDEHELDDNIDSDNSDDEKDADLAERLGGIDLNDADLVWEQLTNDERLEFEGLLNSGDVTNFVPEWIPWWLHKQEKKLVQDVNEAKAIDYKKNCPAQLKTIKPFHEISKVAASACVRFNLVNVLGAYAYTARLFNGEHKESHLEASNCLIAVSTNLSASQNFENVDMALESVGQLCLKYEFLEYDQDAILTMKKDVQLILEGPEDSEVTFYILTALSDIYNLFKTAKNVIVKEKATSSSKSVFSKKFVEQNSEDFPSVPKGKLAAYMKKIEYYLSFVYSNEYNKCRKLNTVV